MESTWMRAVLLAGLLPALSFSVRGQFSENKTPGLGGTSGQLVRFQGADDTVLTPGDKSKYTIAFGTDGSVSARIDCNRGRGTWKSTGPNQLQFGPLALTRASCPPAPLNDRIPKDWEYLRSYTIKDGHLFLSLMADAGIYEFEPASSGRPAAGQVKGTAAYRERLALPPKAVFEAALEDVSRADAPAEVIGRVRIERPGNPPIPFEITYDPSRIDPGHTYRVRARILVNEKLFFTTNQHYPAGHTNEVALLLRRAGTSTGSQSASSGGKATASLENTYWKLTHLGEAPVTAAPKQREPHLVLNPESRRVSGSGGCNRLVGSYEINGDHLSLSHMATTMMACVEGMDMEKTFLDALKRVQTWKITGQELDLFDAGGNSVARFEAVYMK